MKNNRSFTDLMFRPFRFIAGTKALILGLAVLILLSILGFVGHVHFDGALDIHFSCSSQGSYWVHLWYQLSGWFFLTAFFFVLAAIFSKSRPRLIDMAGTLALSKTPLLVVALWGIVPLERLCPEDIYNLDMASLVLVVKEKIFPLMLDSMVSTIFLVWSIVLMYNAFSISGNLKGKKGVSLFILGLLIAEILSKIANNFVL